MVELDDGILDLVAPLQWASLNALRPIVEVDELEDSMLLKDHF